MSGSVKFSEAARLYAEYSHVVDLMYEAFRQSVEDFLDGLGDEIRRLVAPAKLQGRQGDGSRYWWLADDDQDKDAYPQVWLDTRPATIVVPGELQLTAIAPRATPEQLRSLKSVRIQPQIVNYSKPASGGPWSLFSLTVPCREEEPLENVARPIVEVLLALHIASHAGASTPPSASPGT